MRACDLIIFDFLCSTKLEFLQRATALLQICACPQIMHNVCNLIKMQTIAIELDESSNNFGRISQGPHKVVSPPTVNVCC